MHDVYCVDTDHPQDAQGRIRMRIVADSAPDQAAAVRAGRAACLDMLTAAGAFDAARAHTVSAPAYPRPEALVRFALGLGAPFNSMSRFWVQNVADGTLTEHTPSVEDLAQELSSRDRIDSASALADALTALASVARVDAGCQHGVEAALWFFAALRGGDWAAAPKPFRVHGGVGVSWNHTVRREVDGVLRAGGRFSVVITGSRVVFVRTTSTSTEPSSTETVFGTDTATHIYMFFRTELLPGEQENATAGATADATATATPDATETITEAATAPDTSDATVSATEGDPEPAVVADAEAAREAPAVVSTEAAAHASQTQQPGVRLIARWNTGTGDVVVTTLDGDPVQHPSMSAPDETQAAAVLDAHGFEHRGGWASVSTAPGERRTSVTVRSAA